MKQRAQYRTIPFITMQETCKENGAESLPEVTLIDLKAG